MQPIDPEHHDGTSDATPGGEPDRRRPGELGFALALVAASLALLWNAYGIAGFEALSSPGAIPMATSFVMVVTAGSRPSRPPGCRSTGPRRWRATSCPSRSSSSPGC
jgi:hypothetical protein